MQSVKNLTEGPIRKQLFQLAIPIMGTSFVQMAYSLTDMAWVGRLGSKSVAAIGAVGILTWMLQSFSLLNKVGSEVTVGQAIGSGSQEEAKAYAAHNLTIALIMSLVWGGLFFSFAVPVVSLYKLSPDISAKAVEYLRIVSTAFPFVFLSSAFTGIHNAAGLSKIPFYISSAGLVLNMLLDPLFILGLGWGTAGAAYATWLSECAVILLFVYQLKVRNKLWSSFRFFVPLKWSYTLKVIRIGLPVALLNSFFAVINMLMGRTASVYGGHYGLVALTTGGQIEAIAWNTSQGFSTALSAFTAQNFAAKKRRRIEAAYRATLMMTSVFGLFCTFLFVFYGSEIFSLVIHEKAAYMSGGVFLRIDGYSMMFMMLEITMQGLFYGVGRTMPPAIVSVTFNTLRVPLAVLLGTVGLGINGVWWAISISSILKGLVLFVWYRTLQKKMWRN